MKKFITILFTIVFIFCIGIDIFYACVYFLEPDVLVASTYKLSPMTNATGTETHCFLELKYFKNADDRGLEMFDVKYNYFVDETKKEFYSQGMQYVADSKDKNLSFTYKVNEKYAPTSYKTGNTLWLYHYYNKNFYGSMYAGNGSKLYNYASGDDYKTTTMSSNPINDDSYFTIDFGESGLYQMKFKGLDYVKLSNYFDMVEDAESVGHGLWSDFYDYYYYQVLDVNMFNYILFNSVKNLPSGTNHNVLFEFGDLFDYYECVDKANARYEEKSVEGEKLEKVLNLVKNYFVINVDIVDNGAMVSSDSLFNTIAGNANLNLTGEYVSKDYFYGRDVISVDEYDFDIIKLEDGSFELKLKQEFLNFYLRYKEDIVLSIDINENNLISNNIINWKFTENSGLENFVISESEVQNVI